MLPVQLLFVVMVVTLTGWMENPNIVFICNLLMAKDVDHTRKYLLAIIVSFAKCLFHLRRKEGEEGRREGKTFRTGGKMKKGRKLW